jgi:branched-chain amino acid transport system substrate-binding protein
MKMIQLKILKEAIALVILYFVSSVLLAAQPDNTSSLSSKSTINVGMSTDLHASVVELGKGLRDGIQIYFDKINAKGGIDGRKLNLIVIDDGYEPVQAGINERLLIEKYGVIADIGQIGSPTAVVQVPISNQEHVMLFGQYSGSPVLRNNPPDRYIFNLRASGKDDCNAIVNGFLKAGVKPEEFAFFTQNDTFGNSVYQGGLAALKASGYANPERLPHGTYERNTVNVESGLATIMGQAKSPVRVIITAGVRTQNAAFIKSASKFFPNAAFVCANGYVDAVDFPHTNDTIIIATQVVPYINANLPAAKEYRVDLQKYGHGASPDYLTWQGYLIAKIFVAGLEDAAKAKNLTREGLVDAFEHFHNLDIGVGIPITFTKTDHQAFHEIWPTLIKDGKYINMQWQDLGDLMKKNQPKKAAGK